jgi:hypothetical protein
MFARAVTFLIALSVVLLSAGGCSEDPTFTSPPRAADTRAPRTEACDGLDETRCLLPFPSNSFARLDPSTATGLRLAIPLESLPNGAEDTAAFGNLADGFSRVTPFLTGYPDELDPLTVESSARVVVSQPGHPNYGVAQPMIAESVTDEGEVALFDSLLLAYPRAPLAAGTDHVAVVLNDTLRFANGKVPEPSRGVRVALGLENAKSEEDAGLFAYHAPTRAALEKAGIAFDHIVRMTEFTTRSSADATTRLLAMRQAAIDAVTSGKSQVVWTKLKMHDESAPLVFEGEGHLTNVPGYVTADKQLSVNERGEPVAVGTVNAPFRVTVPRGSGDYRMLVFGHGTGGEITDNTFDGYLGRLNVGKLNYRFDGWTENEVIPTVLGFLRAFRGAASSTAQLLQGLANGAATSHALGSILGDALAADVVGPDDTPNPAKGRRPKLDVKLWGGGSMGGTMGLVVVSADPTIRFAVLNVPGAAWTHFIPRSAMFKPAAPLLRSAYHSNVTSRMVFAMTQTVWDDVDGAVWADAGPKDDGGDPAYLIQESVGDTVIDNIGTEMLAHATSAVLVGPVLDEIGGLARVDVAEARTGMSQFRVPFTGDYDIHGFANCTNRGGEAARQQIQAFFESVWAGAPRVTYPSASCQDSRTPGTCDFDGMWTDGCKKVGAGF